MIQAIPKPATYALLITSTRIRRIVSYSDLNSSDTREKCSDRILNTMQFAVFVRENDNVYMPGTQTEPPGKQCTD